MNISLVQFSNNFLIYLFSTEKEIVEAFSSVKKRYNIDWPFLVTTEI